MNEITGNVRGMRDLLDRDSNKKNEIELIARDLANKFGYQEITTPIVEYSSVFNKSLGLSSDIVNKEMYNFVDEKKRKLTLRPEGTAGIARAIASNGLLGSGEYRIPLKLFLCGPMFRYERPQKGRYRQFNQVNFEYFGEPSPECDLELISLAHNFLKKNNVKSNLIINSLGDNESRQNYRKVLVDYIENHKNILSDDSKTRLKNNPLRILDSKDKKDIKILANVPSVLDFLSTTSKKYYIEIKQLLNELKIDFQEDHKLVRGLDYYKETVFEFKTNQLGTQQDTILGGGRYSGLVKMFGGKDIGGVGWAAGIDRIIDISREKNRLPPKVSIVFDKEFKTDAIKLTNQLRCSKKINDYIEINYGTAIEKQIKKANKHGSKFIIYIENNKKIKIKDKSKNKDHTVSIFEVDKIIKIINVN